MSDTPHTQDGDEPAGHEVDKVPNRRLFNLLFGLSALILLSSIGVIQLFNQQVASLEAQRAEQGSYRLYEYKEEARRVAEGFGEVVLREHDGAETARYYIPITEAKKQLLEDGTQLAAQPEFPGWEQNTDTGQKHKQVADAALQRARELGQPAVPPPADGAAPPPGQPEPGAAAGQHDAPAAPGRGDRGEGRPSPR